MNSVRGLVRGRWLRVGVFVIGIMGSAAVGAETPGIEPEKYTRAWINSHANPMLHEQTDIMEFYRKWRKMSPAEKEEAIAHFRRHGWELVEADEANSTFVWRNIYEKERIAAVKANREAFVKLLDPQQLVAWQKMQRPMALVNLRTRETPKPPTFATQTPAEHKQATAEFLALLTPELKAEYDRIPDFTRANW